MATDPLPPQLQQNIRNARALSDRPHEKRFVEPATAAETLEQRVQSQPNALFLTYLAEDGGVRSYTYAEFHLQVRRLAALMKTRGGIQRGSRVATAMHNCDSAILVNFAAWHLGASVVPLNMGEDDKRLDYVLKHSDAGTLFVLGEYAKRMRVLFPLAGGRKVFSCEWSPADRAWASPIEEHLESGNSQAGALADCSTLSPDDEALIVYTSGTTGVPKGVVLTQYNLIADAYAITRWHGFTQQTRMMCVLPVHHVNGLVVTHVTPMFCGGSVVLNRKFSARHFFETASHHAVHVASVVPTLLQFLLEATSAGVDARALAPALCYLICGAGPLTVELASRFEERFGIPICHGYGLSETTCYSCFLPPFQRGGPEEMARQHQEWMRAHGYPSIGVPVCTNEMAIHDEHGNPLPEGIKGEIVIRGHNVTPGYHDNLKANADAFTHGWFRSGDEGFYKSGPNGESYFFISGRFKELIIRGGVKISPLEVDEVLNGIQGVKAAMAVGFENVTYGEEVGAYVVRSDPTLNAEQVLSACRGKLPFAMSPKVVIFGENFPVTSTGKYQRNQLKPLFAAYHETLFREKP